MNYKYKLGIIGAGNMAGAILKGITASQLIDESEIIISDASEDALKSYSALNTTCDNDLVLKESEFVIFAVKPQIFKQIKQQLTGKVYSRVLISIMAGIKSSFIAEISDMAQVVRVMPNTPCMLSMGMTAIQTTTMSESDKKFVFDIFSSVGKVLEIDEKQFDAVTAVSGSGPAYVYMFIKAMVEAGQKFGLSEADSKTLALQTFRGAVEMVDKCENKTIADLISAVSSKGGTTVEAVDYFNQSGLNDTIIQAMTKCHDKSVCLGK